jgi:hypothetical protein
MPKRRGNVAHFGGCLAKHYGWPAMFCGHSSLDKFQSVPYASRKCVVTLDYAVLVGKSWYYLKLLKVSIFEVFSYYPCLHFILSMITMC